jgi:peptide/nickel transport system permease protein
MVFRYIVRRLVRSVILLFGVSAISFCLFEVAPGDYFDEMRLDPAVSTDTIAALREHHGVDDPVIARYVRWVASILQGDWGTSIAYNSPSRTLLFDRACNTLILTVSASLCAWTIAVPFAVWSAVGGNVRRLFANSLVSVLLSVPELLILMVFMAAADWQLLLEAGMSSPEFSIRAMSGKTVYRLSHVAVPILVLVLTTLPTLILHTRAAFIAALDSPFVRFAQANGIPRNRLLVRHAFPAAANPLVTLLGLCVGTLLSSSLLVEAVAGWPGLGQLLLQALLQRDLVLVAGAVLLSSVFLIGGNLVADLLLYAVDPRIGEKG